LQPTWCVPDERTAFSPHAGIQVASPAGENFSHEIFQRDYDLVRPTLEAAENLFLVAGKKPFREQSFQACKINLIRFSE
jgi:hypothetical protein